MEGRGDFRLCEKWKRLKVILRWWKIVVFGWVDLSVEEHVGDLNVLDNLLIDNHGVSIDKLVDDRSKFVDNLWNKLEINECMLRNKSRHMWLKDEDKNSRFLP